MTLRITTEFEWNDKVHGNSAESFWIWVEDPDNQTIYHSEYLMIEKKKVRAAEDARRRGKTDGGRTDQHHVKRMPAEEVRLMTDALTDK